MILPQQFVCNSACLWGMLFSFSAFLFFWKSQQNFQSYSCSKQSLLLFNYSVLQGISIGNLKEKQLRKETNEKHLILMRQVANKSKVQEQAGYSSAQEIN